MLRKISAALAGLALSACATVGTAQGDPGPIAVYGNKQTFEIAPVLVAAEHYYAGEAAVHMGSLANLVGAPPVPGFGEEGEADVATNAETQLLRYSVDHPNLRIVLKEFPILGPDSTKAHVVSMAFRSLMPEKYGDFHNQLLGGQGRASEATAMKIALSLGADEEKLREEMKNPAINAAFEKTYELANKLAITGTPSYVVGNEVVFGALGQEVLAQKIAEARTAATKASN